MMIGTFLRKLREKKGLSQVEVAEGICSRSHLSKVERGKRLPSVDLLADLAQKLEVPLSELVEPFVASDPGTTGLLRLVSTLATFGHHELAESLLEQAESRIDEDPSPDLYQPFLYETQAVMAYRRGDLETTLELYQEALSWRERVPSRTYELVRAYFRVGTLCMQLGDMDRAEEVLFRAFQHVQWIDPTDSRISSDRVEDMHESVVRNLGLVYLHKREPNAARAVYHQALDVWERYEIVRTPAPFLVINMALAELGTGHFDDARHLLSGLLTRPDVDARARVAVRTNMGLLCRLDGDWQGARLYQETAWNLFQEHQVGRPRTICIELARCAIHDGRLSEAREWLLRGAELQKDSEPNLVAETALLQARIARLEQDWGLARDMLHRAYEIQKVSAAMINQLHIERLRLALDLKDWTGMDDTLSLLERELGNTAL